MRVDRLYILWGLIVLALSYTIPYLVLRDCKSLLLYLFWLILTVAHLIVSLTYIGRWREWTD